MAIQGKNALANLLNGADPPAQGSSARKAVNKDDSGFDAALGMALFAHPSFVPPSNPITDGARDKGALADKTSALAVPSPSGGDSASQIADYGVRQSLGQNPAIDNNDTAGPRYAAAAIAAFENFAASSPTDGNTPSAARAGEGRTPTIDLVAGDAPSPSVAVSVSPEGTGNSPDGAQSADDPAGVPAHDPKPPEGSYGVPASDPKPLEGSYGLPVRDPKPLVSESDNLPRPTTGDAIASVARPVGLTIGNEAIDPGLPSKPVTGLRAHDVGRTISGKAPGGGSVLNLTDTTAQTAGTGELPSHVEAPAAPAFDGSQPKSAAARANAPDAEKETTVTGLGGQPSADASGRQTASVSDAQGKSAASNQIPDSIEPSNRPAASENDKRNPVSRTEPVQPASPRPGANNGIASATTSVADIGTGASRPAAGPAPVSRMIATPAPAAKVANLRIDLAAGQSTQATVRERSGAVDVRIVTANEQSAQLIGAGIPSLRRALDAAGMQLKTADVQHQGGGANSGHQGERQTERQWRTGQRDDGAIFNIEEVKQ